MREISFKNLHALLKYKQKLKGMFFFGSPCSFEFWDCVVFYEANIVHVHYVFFLVRTTVSSHVNLTVMLGVLAYCCTSTNNSKRTSHYVFGASFRRPLSVRPLALISSDAIYLLSGGISMKLAINIHHVSGNCWKCFKVRGQRSRSKQSAVIARGIPSARPSVCPSRSSIVSRRMKIRSCGFSIW